MSNPLIPEYAVVITIQSHSAINYLTYINGNSIFENQKNELAERVTDIYEDCKKENWDDEGAKPVTLETWNIAESFVRVLPNLNMRGSAFATSNGKIGFQWTKGNSAVSMLIDSSGEIICAVVLKDKPKGSWYETFSGSLPSDIREYLLQISKFN